MQNKKSLLQRMLVIYITFFVILIAGVAHSFLPSFLKGYHEGATIGENIVENWRSETPRQIYLLGEVPLSKKQAYRIEGIDTTSTCKITSTVGRVELTVDEPAEPGISGVGLAFRSIGGSPWLYLLTVLGSLSYLAIIVLMFIIIQSIRRSIKEERTLDSHNVWYIRSIGFLTIFAELSQSVVSWQMKSRAAELLSGSAVGVDTTFTLSYSTIIMGILIIFTAEVFAIGQNLSEEQKLTI